MKEGRDDIASMRQKIGCTHDEVTAGPGTALSGSRTHSSRAGI